MTAPLIVLVVATEPRASEWAAWLSAEHVVRTTSDAGGPTAGDVDIVVSGRPHGDPTRDRLAGPAESVTVFLPPEEGTTGGETLTLPATDERWAVEAAVDLGAYRLSVRRGYEAARRTAEVTDGGVPTERPEALRTADERLGDALGRATLADVFRTV